MALAFCTAGHTPQEVWRKLRQLSAAERAPHIEPSRAQKAALLSGTQAAPPPPEPPPVTPPPAPPPTVPPPPTPPPVVVPPPPPVAVAVTQVASTHVSVKRHALQLPPRVPQESGVLPGRQVPLGSQQPAQVEGVQRAGAGEHPVINEAVITTTSPRKERSTQDMAAL